MASTSIVENDFGSGIDAQSTENQIAQGFVEDATNVDFEATGSIKKRAGYQGYAGFLPVRVSKLIYSGTSLTFVLDERTDLSTAIDLSVLRSTPLVVYGRSSLSTATGDFTTTDSVHYYPSFSSDIRQLLTAGSGTVTLTAAVGGQTTANLLVGVSESTSSVNNSNSYFTPNTHTVNLSTLDIGVGYTVSADTNAFLYYVNADPVTGQCYVTTQVLATGTNTYTFTAGTHGLETFDVLPQIFENNGTTRALITPDAVTVTDTGTVAITVTNNTGSSINSDIILYAAPSANVKTLTVPAIATSSATFAVDSDFIVAAIYQEQTVGGIRELVLSNALTIDAETRTATVQLVNSGATPANFFIYWQSATRINNRLTVTGSAAAAPFTDSSPQLTIWGLDHRDIYGMHSADERAGWVTHIDSYRNVGERRVITGLGGNLFAAKTIDEAGVTYGYPQLLPNLRTRIGSTSATGPAFYDSSDTPSRTRGYVKFTGGGEGWAQVASVAYNSGTGYTDYTLSVPGLAVTGTPFSTAALLEDWVTIQQAGWSQNNGTFKLKAWSQPSANTLLFSVANSSRDSSDWDEGAGAMAGVFTDQVTTTGNSPFVPGDELLSELWDDDSQFAVKSVTGTTTVVSNLFQPQAMPAGLRVVGRRTGRTVPLRDSTAASAVDLVAGDMLFYTPVERLLRAVSIVPAGTLQGTAIGDGETTTVTLAVGTTVALSEGQWVLLIQSGELSGEIRIESIDSAVQFTFLSTYVGSQTINIHPSAVAVDESFSWQDTVDSSYLVEVPARWVPVESPDDSFNLTPASTTRYFDSAAYTEQAFMRSTMVSGNLYLTNGADEVFKYDGSSVYRAGFPRWQAGLFSVVDTGAAAKIVLPASNAVTVTALTSGDNRFQVAIADVGFFSVGQFLRHLGGTDTDVTYVVTKIVEDTTTVPATPVAYIYVNQPINDPTPGTVSNIYIYRYYVRLHAVDANNNAIISAVTNSQDLAIELVEDAQIRLRFTGFPAWNFYDYSRIELQICRTKANDASVFYRLTNIPLDFNSDAGYVDYIDTAADEDLVDADLQAVAIAGAELPTQVTEPVRAKYITSDSNRLVLGNLRDYPELNVQMEATNTILTRGFLGGLRWLFKQDEADVLTTTDNSNRLGFEFRAGLNDTVTAVAAGAGVFDVTTATPNGLSAGNWVYMLRAGITDGQVLDYCGWWMVAEILSATQFRVRQDTSSFAAWSGLTGANQIVWATAKADVPVYLGADGNYTQASGNRSNADPYEFVAAVRLANALNAVARKCDTFTFTNFKPWLIAAAGNDFEVGQVVVRQPKVMSTLPALVTPAYTGFSLYVNQVLAPASTTVTSIERLFPSRLAVSYEGFPEVFDAPTTTPDTFSDSAIDVNLTDGQDLTGVISFFGDSAYGASIKGSVLIAFKEQSLYAVSIEAKKTGVSIPVQRLESMGMGCTAPYSIAKTKDAIVFANEVGIFRLTSALQVEYFGQRLERLWSSVVNRQRLDLVQGHHYVQGRLYKLVYPVAGTDEPAALFAYNHTREYLNFNAYTRNFGSWTRYDAHPSTGWANLEIDSFMATTLGQVFTVRRLGDVTDYRDDASAIPASVTLRAMNFGDSGLRKAVSRIVADFRSELSTSSTQMLSAHDLTNQFVPADDFTVQSTNIDDGISGEGAAKVQTIAFSINRRKLMYIQIQLTNSAIDDTFELAGLTYRVVGLSEKGIPQAANSGGTR